MSNKTKVVTARVSNEIADRLEQMAEGTTKSDIVEKAIKAYDDISTVCMWGDISLEDFCREIKEKFMDGTLVVNEGKINEKRD